MRKILLLVLALFTGIITLFVSAFVLLMARSLRFAPVQDEPVYSDASSLRLRSNTPFSVMSWNVQYMAGKNHVFWYDLQGNRGPDTRPTPQELKTTLAEVARVIRENAPDVILLQEVDDRSARSGHQDQLKELQLLLPEEYRHHASAFYWQSAFVPHPALMGSVGMKLSVLSRCPIRLARRHALADVPRPFLLQPFNIRRALLEVRLLLDDGREIAVVNTHLEAFVEGTPVMERQVLQLDSLLRDLNQRGVSWVAGGDLNLLPPGAYDSLDEKERWLYNPQSEMNLLYKNHPVLPALEQVESPQKRAYWTHYPNRPWSNGPDRTIDYLLRSPDLQVLDYQVIRDGTLHISDHLPVMARFGFSSGKGI